MFKKTLVAAAIGALSISAAYAADVTVYGVIDYGMVYNHDKAELSVKETSASAKEDSFTMDSGVNSATRFGLRGSEDLGNGLKVGFVLENGFDADTGALTTTGKIFDREAQAYLEGAFGRISMGRVGQLASMNGSYGILGVASPFSSGWGQTIGPKHVMAAGLTRFDNTVTYVTPDFAGFKVHAQYSFKNSDAEGALGDEGKPNTDRYYGIGATYNAGPLALVGVVDSINYRTQRINKTNGLDDDSLSVTLGGSYDFEVVKVYALGQYFDNASGFSSAFDKDVFKAGASGVEGWGLSLGVSAPAFGGTARAQMGYMDAEDVRAATAEGKNSFNRYMFSVGYDYNLSKRTSLYTAANFTKDDYKHKTEAYNAKPQTYEIMAGMIHRF